MRRISSWQAVALLIVAGLVFVLLAVVLFWLAVAVCVLGLVVWLHLVGLPRLAERLHLPLAVLEVLLLLIMLGGGLVVGGLGGATAGAALWVVGVGLPRIAGKRLRPQVRVVRWTTTLDADSRELPP